VRRERCLCVVVTMMSLRCWSTLAGNKEAGGWCSDDNPTVQAVKPVLIASPRLLEAIGQWQTRCAQDVPSFTRVAIAEHGALPLRLVAVQLSHVSMRVVD
jgi:hypothetical protein